MEHLEAYNRKLLANILPVHVAEHFLTLDKPVDVSTTTYTYNKTKLKCIRHFFSLVLFSILNFPRVKHNRIANNA